MNRSKYQMKNDVKHDIVQAGATVEVPTTAPTVVKIHETAHLDQQGLDAKSGVTAPAAAAVEAKPAEAITVVKAATPADGKAEEAMVGEGGYVRAVREPDSAVKAPAPDASLVNEGGEKPAVVDAKTIS